MLFFGTMKFNPLFNCGSAEEKDKDPYILNRCDILLITIIIIIIVIIIIIIIITIITRIFIQDNLSVLIKRTVIKRVL